MSIPRSFFDCPTTQVVESASSSNPNNENSSSSSNFVPPPAIPSGFEIISSSLKQQTTKESSSKEEYQMITFALGKIFCYSCIGNITECVKDELSSLNTSSSQKERRVTKIIGVTATRIPMDLLSVVVKTPSTSLFSSTSLTNEEQITIRQELWSVVDSVIQTVSGPKCGEKLCCLLDRHPLQKSSYCLHFLVDNNKNENISTLISNNNKNRQRSFFVFAESDAKKAFEKLNQDSEERKRRNNSQARPSSSEELSEIITTTENDTTRNSSSTNKSKPRKLQFIVEGMSCASCARNIENTINKKFASNSNSYFVPNSASCSFAACSATITENISNNNSSMNNEERQELAHQIEQTIIGLGFKCTSLLKSSNSDISPKPSSSKRNKRNVIDFSGERSSNRQPLNNNNENDNDQLNEEDTDDDDEDDEYDEENRLTKRAIEREEEISQLTKQTQVALAGGIPLLLMMMSMMTTKDTGGNPFFRTMHIRILGNVTFENFIGFVLSTPVVWYSGRPFFQRAWNLFVLSRNVATANNTSSSSSSSSNDSFSSQLFDLLSNSGMNMDTLVSVGVGVSYFTSVIMFLMDLFSSTTSASSSSSISSNTISHNNMNFDTAAVLLAFVCFGKLLEAKAKRMTGDALISLMKLTPKLATIVIINDDHQQQQKGTRTRKTVSTKSLQIGNYVEVLPGDNVPTDGIIVEGTTEIGEALVTGESLPVKKEIGSQVIGGTQNLSGPFIFRVTKVGKDTVVANILQIVRNAQQSKPTILRVTDKIAAVFVPIVLMLATVVFCVWAILGLLNAYPEEWRSMIFEYGMESASSSSSTTTSSPSASSSPKTTSCSPLSFAFSFALATVVVACPCALGLAAPTAIMVGTGVGAKNGILLKSAEAMERANSVDCVVFDKTGTLTTGKMAVKKVRIHRDLLISSSPTTSNQPDTRNRNDELEKENDDQQQQRKKLPSSDSLTMDEDNVVFVSSIGRQHLKKKLQQTSHAFDDDDLNLLMNSSLLMKCVAALEGKSLHPIAKAICRYAKNINENGGLVMNQQQNSDDDDDNFLHHNTNSNSMIEEMTEWKQIPGRGISANVKITNTTSTNNEKSCWKRIAVGNLKFLQEDEQCSNAFSEEASQIVSSSSTIQPSSKKKMRVIDMMMRKNGATADQQPQELQQSQSYESSPPPPSYSSTESEVVICVAVDRRFVATIHLADTIKKDAIATISFLRQHVQGQIWMITGDTAESAKAVAEKIGISRMKVLSNKLPHEKVEAVRLLQEHKGRKTVAFVGDGINDAAALTQANLGIALGAGTDVAIDAADAVLVQNNLFSVCTLLDLAKTTIRRIYINFLWAIIYNLIMLPLSCGMFFWLIKRQLPPVVAGAAMMFSSLSVVGSSLMLKWYSAPSSSSFSSSEFPHLSSSAPNLGKLKALRKQMKSMRRQAMKNDDENSVEGENLLEK